MTHTGSGSTIGGHNRADPARRPRPLWRLYRPNRRRLKIRHDHGSVYLSDDFQDELDFLGMESSPSFVREPQGNGCAERFIGLLKENLLWVRTFATIEELRQALVEFKQQYNQHWILQRHGYKTPAQVRQEKREVQYAEAAG